MMAGLEVNPVKKHTFITTRPALTFAEERKYDRVIMLLTGPRGGLAGTVALRIEDAKELQHTLGDAILKVESAAQVGGEG